MHWVLVGHYILYSDNVQVKGLRRGNGFYWPLVAAFIFVPIGMLQSSPDIMFSWSILPVALAIADSINRFPYTLEMIAHTFTG